ncbi:MAG: DUF1592 domain-containing protein [Gemmatimonadetes bacterium]|nr:DUF1592 domain-containing protein [Gemmatimonadota bacterium]
MDRAAARDPNPGRRVFQRLNRAEYARSIQQLLDLDVDAGTWLPLDTKSANFDNIADVQLLSPTMMDAYLRAADEISRLAVGDPAAAPTSITYTNSGYVSQWERVPGAPRGTRGGISVVHNFPADAQYTFDLWLEHTTTGEFTGGVTPGEQIEISIDGERLALLEVDRWMHVSDPNGLKMSTEPFFVRAGPHRVSAAFLRIAEGPIEDVLSPHDWSLTDRKIGSGGGYGITVLAHLKDLVILGPHNPTGVSETPSRRAIFTCRPTAPAEARPCAEEIVSRLASKAFRRPLRGGELQALMSFYDQRAAEAGFDVGVRTALQAILASPDFVLRLEEAPGEVEVGETYRISDADLAARLSFFLWGAPPDVPLLEIARAGKLSDLRVLAAQARRMLDDPRAAALGARFAAQWLRLEDLEKVNPDRLMFPDFHEQLGHAMLQETQLFFNALVEEDRSMLELFTADYTFVNERLAKHYGIPGVAGEHFRRVEYPNDMRRGLLGHGSMLMLTSHANRTSPVLRGKWVMEVLMGTPPPPPPPGVPTLEATAEAKDGRELTTRERMELHRTNAICKACHQFMDPIGLALDNFDVTGKWRIRENGMPLDTRGQLYDGTSIANPTQLQRALLQRPIPLVRNFTVNLMAYALGRRVEYYDMPAVRQIARKAEANDYRLSSFILGVIESEAFRMKRTAAVASDAEQE